MGTHLNFIDLYIISLLSAEFAHSVVSVIPGPAEPRYTLYLQTV